MGVVDVWMDGRKRRPGYGKGKRWMVRWRDGDGVQRKKRFDYKDEALIFEAEQRLSPAQRATRETVSQLFDAWIPTKKNLQPKTLEGYKSSYNCHIKQQLGARPLSSLTARELREWFYEIQGDGAARQAVVVLRSMLGLAVREELLETNLAKALETTPSKRRSVDNLTQSQIEALAEAIAPHDLEFWMLLACGLRFGEMAALEAKKITKTATGVTALIDRKVQKVEGEIIWGLPKGNKTRVVPIPSWIYERLPRKKGLLLPSPNGGPWLTESWRPVWERARRTAGLDGLRTHDLRHIFAARQIEAGTDLKTLQQVMGHAKLSITIDLYGSMARGDLSRVADITGRVIS